jgi:glutathione S-transferase
MLGAVLEQFGGKIMTLFAPATLLTALATVLAILVTLGTAILVARTRHRVDIDAPAMSGAPALERALRVQGNTIEQFVIFVPALWLAALYFQGWIPGLLGLVWSIGRIIYAFGYGDRKQRFPGFALTVFPTIILTILALIGIVQAWTAATAS